MTAAYLEIRAGLYILELFDNFTTGALVTEDDVLDGDLIPKEPFEQHYVRLLVPASLVAQEDPPFAHFAIRTWNHKKAYSKLSNIANAYIYDPLRKCPRDFAWPHDLTPRARPKTTTTTTITERLPAGPTDDSESALPQPASPSPPTQVQVTSATLVTLGILLIVLLLVVVAAGVWYQHTEATEDLEGANEHPVRDPEKAVEPLIED